MLQSNAVNCSDKPVQFFSPMLDTFDQAITDYTRTCGRCGFAITGYRRALQYSIGDQWSWDGRDCYAVCECPNCRASFLVPKFSGSVVWKKDNDLLNSR